MLRIEDHCVGCSDSGMHCMGSHCPNRNVRVFYCDNCEEEIIDGDVYEVDGVDLCEECLKEMFIKEI